MARAAWFVDGSYLFKCWSQLRRTDGLDYLRLRQFLEKKYCSEAGDEGIDEAYYFGAEAEQPSAGQQGFLKWLQLPPPTGPGFRVKSYWLKRTPLSWPEYMGGQPVVHPETGQPFTLLQQKAVDVGLAFHLMRSFAKRGWEKLFLAAGDADFLEPVQHLVENENVSLALIGTRSTMSSDLQSQARSFVWLDEIAEQVSRPKAQRPSTG